MVGSLFAERYRIELLLGSGGMGTVYQAWDTLGQQDVALKVVREDLLERDELIPRFRREVRAASRIDSPNVARILDFGHDGDSGVPAYLVMELVDGPTLKQVLAEQGALPPLRVLSILSQVSNALTAAHDCQVIHRDLKPGNVMLTPHREGELVKILDFGLAKILGGTGSSMVTPMGHTFGTAEYISPEQAADQELDHRADIYSLGVMAFEMLSGHPPFEGSVVEVVTAQVYQSPPPLCRANGAIPHDLEALVLRCLAKQPDQRPASAAELGRALAEIARLHRD